MRSCPRDARATRRGRVRSRLAQRSSTRRALGMHNKTTLRDPLTRTEGVLPWGAPSRNWARASMWCTVKHLPDTHEPVCSPGGAGDVDHGGSCGSARCRGVHEGPVALAPRCRRGRSFSRPPLTTAGAMAFNLRDGAAMAPERPRRCEAHAHRPLLDHSSCPSCRSKRTSISRPSMLYPESARAAAASSSDSNETTP
jgi:hypothetical protein